MPSLCFLGISRSGESGRRLAGNPPNIAGGETRGNASYELAGVAGNFGHHMTGQFTRCIHAFVTSAATGRLRLPIDFLDAELDMAQLELPSGNQVEVDDLLFDFVRDEVVPGTPWSAEAVFRHLGRAGGGIRAAQPRPAGKAGQRTAPDRCLVSGQA